METTQEQVIAWVREAGVIECDCCLPFWPEDDQPNWEIFFERLATLAYEAGRKAGRKDENEATNAAYKERNQLVALLSTVFPSGKAKTAIEGWDEAWHGCVYIEFPWGQASWHYHDSDSGMFEHLPPYNKQWDGHTTEQKYAAIAAAIRARRKQ